MATPGRPYLRKITRTTSLVSPRSTFSVKVGTGFSAESSAPTMPSWMPIDSV